MERGQAHGFAAPFAFVLLGCVVISCSQPAPTTPVVPAITAVVSPSMPRTDPNTPFVARPLVDSLYMGYGPGVTPESAPSTGAPANCAVTVWATGTLRGSVQKVTATMSDRETGAVLRSAENNGPFLVWDPYAGSRDLLLETGHQVVGAWNDSTGMGFVGRPATLAFDIVVKDTKSKEWTVSASIQIEPFPHPILRSPVGITVRQNDPSSGCSFDPVHGYGIAVNVRWDPPPGDFSISHYIVAIADGAGTELIWPTYVATTGTSYRLVKCGAHVPMGAERGARVAVDAYGNGTLGLSGFAVAHFDFQSCRDAGTPVCQ